MKRQGNNKFWVMRVIFCIVIIIMALTGLTGCDGMNGGSTEDLKETDDKYTLTMDMEGEGTVYPDTGSHQYQAGTVVEISADAAEGWKFTEWLGEVQQKFNFIDWDFQDVWRINEGQGYPYLAWESL